MYKHSMASEIQELLPRSQGNGKKHGGISKHCVSAKWSLSQVQNATLKWTQKYVVRHFSCYSVGIHLTCSTQNLCIWSGSLNYAEERWMVQAEAHWDAKSETLGWKSNTSLWAKVISEYDKVISEYDKVISEYDMKETTTRLCGSPQTLLRF